MPRKRASRIDAVLRHLAAGGDIQDFPGTKYENLALARAVERRGLILWDKEGHRYTLTPAGWGALTPRRFGVTSLLVSSAVGAAIGSAALALLWLPGLHGRDSAYGHAIASLSRAQSPIVAPASRPPEVGARSVAVGSVPADIGGRSVAPMTTAAPPAVKATAPPAPAAATAATAPPAPAAATAPDATPAAPVEPTEVAGAPAEPPAAEPPPGGVKHTAGKHHRTVRHANPYGYARGRIYYDERFSQNVWGRYR